MLLPERFHQNCQAPFSHCTHRVKDLPWYTQLINPVTITIKYLPNYEYTINFKHSSGITLLVEHLFVGLLPEMLIHFITTILTYKHLDCSLGLRHVDVVWHIWEYLDKKATFWEIVHWNLFFGRILLSLFKCLLNSTFFDELGVHLTLTLLRLRASKGQGCKDFWKPSKLCHGGIHWIALTEYSRMSTHLPGVQWFFRGFCIILYWQN